MYVSENLCDSEYFWKVQPGALAALKNVLSTHCVSQHSEEALVEPHPMQHGQDVHVPVHQL